MVNVLFCANDVQVVLSSSLMITNNCAFFVKCLWKVPSLIKGGRRIAQTLFHKGWRLQMLSTVNNSIWASIERLQLIGNFEITVFPFSDCLCSNTSSFRWFWTSYSAVYKSWMWSGKFCETKKSHYKSLGIARRISDGRSRLDVLAKASSQTSKWLVLIGLLQ